LIWIARGSPRPEHPVGWSWPPIGAAAADRNRGDPSRSVFSAAALATEMFARYTDWLRSLASILVEVSGA